MNKAISILTIIIMPLFAISQEMWKPLNPEYEVRSYDMSDSGILYMGATELEHDLTGIYRSFDEGENWEFLYETLHGYKPSHIVCFEDIVYFTSVIDYVHKSYDNGETWEVVFGNEPDLHHLSVGNSGCIYAGGEGLFRSCDEGNTWDTLMYISPGWLEYVKDVVEFSLDTLVICTQKYSNEHGFIYKTVDGGETWSTQVYDRPVSCMAVTSDSTIFAGCMHSQWGMEANVFRSSDFGDTWETVFYYPYMQVFSITISENDYIYFGTNTGATNIGGVWRSEDNGETWELMESLYIEADTEGGLVKVLSDGKLYSTPNFGFYNFLFKYLEEP